MFLKFLTPLVLVSGSGVAQPPALPQVPQSALIAFPGAEGFGRFTTGGRGGQVIKVTNLNDNGIGSLRAAIETKGPRIIVFDVSGTIELRSNLRINNSDITIAGQTAPGDGITLKNYPVDLAADNIIIRFIRFRMGDEAKQEGDAIGGKWRKNIIVDHCSMSWSTDECVSIYNNEYTTLQWCIISESLRNSAHQKGAHGYGGIWGGRFATFHHNLMAHHDSRVPRYGEHANHEFALTDLVDVRNNVFYNWGNNNAYGGEGMNINIVNNYFKPGPATVKKDRIYSPDKNRKEGTRVYNIWGRFYIDGNFVKDSKQSTADNWTYGVYNQLHHNYASITAAEKAGLKKETPHPFNDNLRTYTAQKAYDQVLQFSGASLVRDAVDQRIINDVEKQSFTANGSAGSKNGIIDSQNDVGGWPELKSLPAPKDTDGDGMPDVWEIANKLDPEKANAAGRDLNKDYDNIEVYINSLVKGIIDKQKL
ncbi:pectate lyase [Niabella yanshanensis]|uniref:Pectate lyase n=1 Tax=Niabella yanshanensis TaxID=577386 RepID=A0ABZ0VZE2_9BACT|nr:pectate lyase [Niabella yanshanensis]WQD36393.1 pectate lyase [Niabella yanshanensis]